MSITRTALMALVAVSALTVMTPGHAEAPTQEGQFTVAYNFVDEAKDKLHSTVDTLVSPIVNPKELACLARNIFYEAGSEPKEGKIAVGLVTLNRAQDGRFSPTICGVVNQKLVVDVPKTQTVTRDVKVGWFGKTEQKTERMTVWNKLAVCQFSWNCMTVSKPKSSDERWIESQEVAMNLLANEDSYSDMRDKYSDALYFHATRIHPSWAGQKHRLGRIGGHFFYGERDGARTAQAN